MTETHRGGADLALPMGTVTLLLADVEGSTRLWEEEPETMTEAVARLDAVVAEVMGRHGGARPVEQGEGDSFVAAFARASDAVAAALDLQLAKTAPIRLRIGIHTGEVQLRDEGNYIGPAINRAARLRDMAHGGQIVLSQATADLVVDRLSEHASLRDLGVHRMRDLTRPERVHQLCHPELRSEFPPLRSLDAYPNNLPVQVTTFIGRQAELAELRSLLADTRLLTLTGAGGSGKTRLALQLAADVMTHHADGAWWVDLASVGDGQLVAPTTARTLGFPDEVGRTAIETMERHLVGRRLLVVIDNCEHLIAECASLADQLLHRCDGVAIVATSREPLAIAGETAYRVPSLSLAGGAGQTSEAVELFVDRARRARPGFELTDDNSHVVAEICRRLDGLPLALELAAARLRAFSPQQIADLLEDRFGALAAGSRTALPRQQTLRASVEWSYQLLTDAERVVFRRMAVFAGTFTLDAAVAVGGSDPLEPHHVYDLLALLVDKSLVVFDEANEPPRYRLLEIIRQYALERVAELGEEAAMCRAHRAFFRRSASRLPMLISRDQGDQILLDLDNFRAAMRWSLANDEVEAAVAIVNALAPIWVRGRTTEGRSWYDLILPRAAALDPATRARVLGLSSNLDVLAQDPAAVAKAEDCVALARELGYKPGLAMAMANLSIARMNLDGHVDRESVASYVALAREAGDPSALAWTLYTAAVTMLNAGDPSGAMACADECLEVSTRHALAFGRGPRTVRAAALVARGEPLAALAALDEDVVEDARRAQDGVSFVLATLGWAKALRGLTPEAERLCDEAMAIAEEAGQPLNREWAKLLRGVAALAAGDVPTACDYLSQLHGIVADTATYLAEARLAAGDVAEARRIADEMIATSRARSSFVALSGSLLARSRVALAEGDLRDAEVHAHEALGLRLKFGDRAGTADTLEVLGACAPAAPACRLLGAASSIRAACGAVRFTIYDSWYSSAVGALHAELGEEAVEQLWREGAAMTLEEATAYARRGRGERRRVSSGWASLTPAEQDVVRLLGEGMTNKEIAARLFISPRTVQAHLTHVYTKLDVTSRVQLANEATQRALKP